jgi:uncharacterized membrane protein YeaQ/YmgE (transglycosylase-associated protein family)
VLGIVGSLVGGFVGYILMGGTNPYEPAGWIMSIVGAIVVLGLYVMMTRERPARRLP